MKQVFDRLREGLYECGLNTYVSSMFVLAWEKRTGGGGKTYNYSWDEVRASEHEAVCRVLPFVCRALSLQNSPSS